MKTKLKIKLLEVLIAVFIIGIVGAVVAFLLNIIKIQSADAKRISDINQIAKALELHYDKNAYYPDRLDDLVSAGFLSAVPIPPPGGEQIFYAYVPLGENSICTGYHLGASMETNYREIIGNDTDAYPSKTCAGAGPDFDGTAINCEIGVLGEGDGKGNCYDLKI
ncbi:MAG TPA: hypothetical protein VJI33_01055 [Candidatus Paceibacterota bacterium]